MWEDIRHKNYLLGWVWNFDFCPKLKLNVNMFRCSKRQENSCKVYSQACITFLVYEVKEIAL